MAKTSNKAISRYAQDAVRLMGVLIRNARVENGITVAELAERAGVSRGLVQRTEAGETGTAIGSVFELAALVGVDLFELDAKGIARHLRAEQGKLSLLPQSVRKSPSEVNDDF